ncbi:hypothetical protein GCM10017771_05290 [Streptomyces capitiformicae]|uniref:Uncharacterized protein n=1 Tax=Streptomyces capitiformicae TaxID=2014920 RepID=A0A919GDR0_9ACTN|nr:hypothetical protein GCM10017771_05290 [Streptomyces capitiformicae]
MWDRRRGRRVGRQPRSSAANAISNATHGHGANEDAADFIKWIAEVTGCRGSPARLAAFRRLGVSVFPSYNRRPKPDAEPKPGLGFIVVLGLRWGPNVLCHTR